jgi:ABC-type oligopeptide transport system ATPase subunit
MHRYRVISVVPRVGLQKDYVFDSVESAIIVQDDINVYFIAPDDHPVEPVGPGVYTLYRRGKPGSSWDREPWIKPTAFRDTVLFNSQEAVNRTLSRVKAFYDRVHLLSRSNRGFLLIGPQGSGKSITISHLINYYKAQGGTVTLVWQTDKFHPTEFKDFLQDVTFTADVQRIMLVIEDIGGKNIEPSKMDPTLLSILDNMEVTVKLPLAILATTNFPESLLDNLLDRRGRFDDVIEFTYPDAASRVRYLQTYSHSEEVSDDFLADIRKKEYDTLTVADLEAIVDDARLFQISHSEVLNDIVKHHKRAKKAFTKEKSSLGLK